MLRVVLVRIQMHFIRLELLIEFLHIQYDADGRASTVCHWWDGDNMWNCGICLLRQGRM